MEIFKIYKFSKLFILYLKHSTCETLHRNVVIFAWKTFNIPITWLIFHDFGMIVVLLVQRNQSIKAKVDKKEKKIKLMILCKEGFNKYHHLRYWRKLITLHK